MKPNQIDIRCWIFAILLIFSTCGLNHANAQAKEKADTLNKVPDSTFKYINATDYAFMKHEDNSWLLKFDLVPTLNASAIPAKISFEQRIAGPFTVNFIFDHLYYYTPGEQSFQIAMNGYAETRWYYRLNKQIINNSFARNMSDNYLGLGIGYMYLLNEPLDSSDQNYLSVYAKWGVQRRFLKYGHVDLGLKMGIMDGLSKGFDPSLVLNTYVELGLCFTKDNFAFDLDNACPFIKCYEADRFVFKSNLSSLINIASFNKNSWMVFSPHLAFEHKIGTSAFSINSEIDATLGYVENNMENFNDRYLLTSLILEGRWYYNLKKRIRYGFSGNGLSANYLCLGGSYNYNLESNDEKLFDESGPQIHVGIGWQRLLGNHLYYDIQIGENYYFNPDIYNYGFGLRTRLALGYRF